MPGKNGGASKDLAGGQGGALPEEFGASDLNEVLVAMRDGLWAMDALMSSSQRGQEGGNGDPRLQMRLLLQKYQAHPVLGQLPVFTKGLQPRKAAATPRSPDQESNA